MRLVFYDQIATCRYNIAQIEGSHSSGAEYNTRRLVASMIDIDPACNIPMRYTDARDAYVCA